MSNVPKTGQAITPKPAEDARDRLRAASQMTGTNKNPLEPDEKGMYRIPNPAVLPNPPAPLNFTVPIDPELANEWLMLAQYPARVEKRDAGYALIAENGSVPLASLTKRDMARALISLGISPPERLPHYLALVSTLLDGGKTDRTWTEGDRQVPDLLGPRTTSVAQTAVRPEFLGGKFDLTSVRLPKERVELTFASQNLPADLKAYADHLIATFDNGDGTVTFPVHNQQIDRIYPSTERGQTMKAQPTSSDRTMSIGDIRLKMDLSQIKSVNASKPLSKEDIEHDMRMWRTFSGFIESDPVLRLHACTQPEVVAFTDNVTGLSNLGRYIQPYPPHPRFPAGTHAVSLKTLLTEASGEQMMLQSVLENRPNQEQTELEFFMESFVRPTMKVFRRSIDQYGFCLFNWHEKNIAFELSTEFLPTGRVVINDFGDLRLDTTLAATRATKKDAALLGMDTTAAKTLPLLDEPRSLIWYGMDTFYDTLGVLGDAFARCQFAGKSYSRDDVRAALEKVVTQEMRFLRPDTATVLGTDHTLGRFVHSVSAVQQKTLSDVVARVEQHVRDRRSNPALKAPAVVVDLDLCGFDPTLRARAALARTGEAFNIPELSDPQALPVLPAYHAEGFAAFLERSGLQARYPDADWKAIAAAYEDHFFDKDLLASDVITPGLGEYLRRLDDLGAKVYFVTGRREADRDVTLEVLKRAGFVTPNLLMMPDDCTTSVEDAKYALLEQVKGDVVAGFDDLRKNRARILERFPSATGVEVAIKGFAGEAGAEGAPRIESFEFQPAAPGAPDQAVQSVLSGANAVTDFALADMSLNPVAKAQSVTMSPSDAQKFLAGLDKKIHQSAKKLTEKAARRVDKEMPGLKGAERTAAIIFDLMTHKPYIKGRKDNWTWEDARPKLLPFVEGNKPVSMVLPAFPIKEDKDRMKALGHLPDLGEMAAFLRMKELHLAIAEVHKPGLKFTALMDGHHYRAHYEETADMVEDYMAKLAEYVRLIGAEDIVDLQDYDDLAVKTAGAEYVARQQQKVAELIAEYDTAFAGLDVGTDPLGTLQKACERDPSLKGDIKLADLGDSAGEASNFKALFSSMLWSVKVPTPPGRNRQDWSREVLADIFNVSDPIASKELIASRQAVLRRTWQATIGYLSTVRADREIKFSSFAAESIRATIHPKQGQYGYCLVTPTGFLTPWHGTAAVSEKGDIGVDFVVALQDQGFVPVYAPFLGSGDGWLTERQPFFMAPVKQVQNGRLVPAFADKISLHD